MFQEKTRVALSHLQIFIEIIIFSGPCEAGGGAVPGAHPRGGLAALLGDVRRHQEQPQGHARPQGEFWTQITKL